MAIKYKADFDDAMRQICDKLKSIEDARAKEVIELIKKIQPDVMYTESGLAMNAAIEEARDIFKEVLSRAHLRGYDCISNYIENRIKNDPFYGDLIRKGE